MKCTVCSKELSSDDMGYHKKLVNRGETEKFRCIECNCEYYGLSVDYAYRMIEHFKKQGCTLF